MPFSLLPLSAMIAVWTLLFIPDYNRAQPPVGPVDQKPPKMKPPPDEFKALVKEVEEAYKAPFEVNKSIRDELRKQYENPTPEREEKILREARRLYNLTPDQEQDIVVELRKAYENPSPDAEARVFQAVQRNGMLPLGTVSFARQADRAAKLFADFDSDRDGRLSGKEAPDTLRDEWHRWDHNGDMFIDFSEYRMYLESRLRIVADRVAAGEIEIKLPRGSQPQLDPIGSPPSGSQKPNTGPPRLGNGSPALPDWFKAYDADGDGQVSLYEWRQEGKAIEEFRRMDLDGDGLLTAQEYRRFLIIQARDTPPD